MPSSRYTFAAATGWHHVAAETWLTPSSRPPPIGQCGECQTSQLPLPGACGNGMCSWARTLTEAAAIVLCGNGSFDNLPRKTSLRLYVRLLGCLLQRRCANVTYGSCGREALCSLARRKLHVGERVAATLMRDATRSFAPWMGFRRGLTTRQRVPGVPTVASWHSGASRLAVLMLDKRAKGTNPSVREWQASAVELS